MDSGFGGDYDVIITRLRRAREAAGLSQRALATQLGQSRSWVSKIESGQRRLDVAEMRQLARATGAHFDALLTDLPSEAVSRPMKAPTPKRRRPGVVLQGPWRSPR